MSSKYWTGNSVVVPSQADGVKMGVSARMKPRLLKKSRHGVDDLVPDAQDGLLPRRADPEVPAIEEVVDAVLLWRDGVVVRGRDHVEGAHVELVAAGRPLVRPHRPGDDDGALLAEMVGLDEGLLADRRLRHDGLDEAGAVADGQEVDLAAGPAVVQPALQRHGLTFVSGNVLDVGGHRAQGSRLKAQGS